MRSYPNNSPEAAGRILALTMIADGHLARSELDVLMSSGAHSQIGISADAMRAVIQTLCEDLLAAAHHGWSDVCNLEQATLTQVLGEVQDPALRRKLIQLCVMLVESDGHVSEGESTVIAAALEQWGLQRIWLEGSASGAAFAHA